MTLNTLKLSRDRLLIGNVWVKRMLNLLTFDIWIWNLEHKVDEHVVPQQEDSGPVALGHKVDILVALGRRGLVPGALDL